MDEVSTIVCDQGTNMFKAGYAGDSAPRAVFPAITAKFKTPTNPKKPFCAGYELDFFSRNAEKYEPNSIRAQYNSGSWIDFDMAEHVYYYMFYNEIRAAPEEHPVIICDSLLSSKLDREKLVQLMFETFNVPAFYIALDDTMSLYASGRVDGVVLNIGENYSRASVHYEGAAVRHVCRYVPYAGSHVTAQLIKLALEQGLSNVPIAEFDAIKARHCHVALDGVSKQYELPDGTMITLGNELFEAPEVLFQPSYIGMEDEPGIHELVYKSIMAIENDYRKAQWANIVLSGGGTMFDGMANRMSKEMYSLNPSNFKIRVIAPPERKYSVWIGASILGSMSTFQQWWISKEEYDEMGPRVVHPKCIV